jgi:hypothetical protein
MIVHVDKLYPHPIVRFINKRLLGTFHLTFEFRDGTVGELQFNVQ